MPVNHRGGRVLLITASLIVVLFGLHAAAGAIVPMLMAAFLAILCVPGMRRLQRRGVPEWLALVIVMLVASAVILLITAVIGSSFAQFQQQSDFYAQRIEDISAGVFALANEHGIDVGESGEAGLASKLNGKQIMGLINTLAGGIFSALSNVLLVLLTMIFILLEVNGMSRKLRHILGGPDADLSEFSGGARQVQVYVATKAIVSLATGVCVALLCFFAGVDFPLLWALLAFLFNFIPNIGSIIAAIPAVMLTLLQHGFPRMAVVGLGYIAINLIIGNVVEPKLMGRRLGLSTLVVFLSMVFWGEIWGPVGMLLSVPLTVIVKILLEHSDDFAWVAVLLGTGAEADAAEKTRERRAAEQPEPDIGPDSDLDPELVPPALEASE